MPGLFAHYICGQKFIEAQGNSPFGDLLKRNMQVFNLGTQGPDIFYFYCGLPFKHNREINRIGGTMHQGKIGNFFKHSISYILDQNSENAELLASYMSGFICHYTLDSCSHPYIYCRSGFICKKGAPAPRVSGCHSGFETAIDVLMLDRVLSTSPRHLDASSLIKVSHEQSRIIGEMYKFTLSYAYEKQIAIRQVCKAIKDIGFVYRILRDKKGYIRKLLSRLEKKLDIVKKAISMIAPFSIPDSKYYFNENHEPWLFDWETGISGTDSFPDLFNKSVIEADKMAKALFSCLKGTLNIEEALHVLGSRSFLTGLETM